MTEAQMKKEITYCISVAPFKKMLENNVISIKDYSKIDTILRQKYCPIFVECIIPERLAMHPNQS
ncbi:MAG TPA: SHOCT domain-containing protein [Caproicibacter sp.]|nr:SHOCT domain-containing protein [Caproicibacter sp.]